ncbi:MAG: bifunctional riboflavin kinase/FAD synthetase [Myxococcales bacterium]|nr:bifunctional riboflavin kinase/FAD synthetase [Myxococcales bacterium]
MNVFRGSSEVGDALVGCAVVIGNFDGVHLGHQALFARARQLAGAGGTVAALTFEPHPARYFKPELAPPLIDTDEQKLRLLEAQSVDGVIVERFDADLAALTPHQFVKRVLVDAIRAAHVVVGEDFVFGKQRSGNLATLQALGEDLGFIAHGVEHVRADAIIVSSTKVREFVLMGRPDGARALLGRPFTVVGEVVKGDGRGSTIGVPTANVNVQNGLRPARGVYAGFAIRADGSRHPSVINVGYAPTIKNTDDVTFEAHLLDMRADMLGETLAVELWHRLRDEKRFGSVDELVAQIHADIARGRELLGANLPASAAVGEAQ